MCLTVAQWTQNKTRQLVNVWSCVCAVGLCYPTFVLSFSGCFAAVARSLLVVTHLSLSPSPPESDASVAALWSRPLPSSVVHPYLLTLCRSNTAGKPAKIELGVSETEDHAALCYRRMLPFWMRCSQMSDCRRTSLNDNHVYTTPVLLLQSGLCVIALYLGN